MAENESVYHYTFKPKSELMWFVAVAVITVLMHALVEFDPDAIVDLRAWAVGLGAAMIRSGAGAFLAYVVRYGTTYNAD